MKRLATVLVALALFTVVSNTRAVASLTSVTYTGSAPTNVKSEKGVTLKASATFTVSNLDLIIELSNISTNDPRSASDILTGIFFDISTNLTLTKVSAAVAPGSKVIGPLLGYNGDVSGQWAYRGNLPTGSLSKDAPGEYGLSSTKFSFFKKSNLFSDTKFPRTSPLSSVQFGITDMSELATKAQGSIKNADLIQNTIVLILNGLPVDFSLADISGVTFVFGTSASIKKGIDIGGTMVAQIPEPSTVVLVAIALAGVLTLIRSSVWRR
jgi:hypothetical protein